MPSALFGRLKKAFPFLGERAATEDDLFEFCAERGVEVVFDRVIERGIYARQGSREAIFLNPQLHGTSLIYVLAHEAAHMLLHAGRSRNFVAAFNCRRHHREAEVAAALMIWPTPASLGETHDAMNDEMIRLAVIRIDHAAQYGE